MRPDFQIGWRLSIERYGLRLEELREVTADIFDRELIDYLDLALWDSAQVVREGPFRGKTMLSLFAELPRKGVRLGTAGKIMSAKRAGELLDEGCDFVLIARAGILQRDFPLQVMANPTYDSPELPVPAEYLRERGLSERFIDHMRDGKPLSCTARRRLRLRVMLRRAISGAYSPLHRLLLCLLGVVGSLPRLRGRSPDRVPASIRNSGKGRPPIPPRSIGVRPKRSLVDAVGDGFHRRPS